MWKGAVPSLKAMPDTTNTSPKTARIRFAWLCSMAKATRVSSSEPVAP